MHGANPALGWPQGETFNGSLLSRRYQYPHGAFVYRRVENVFLDPDDAPALQVPQKRQTTGRSQVYMYSLMTPADPLYPHVLPQVQSVNWSATGSEADLRHGDALSKAFHDLRKRSIGAKKSKEEAAKVTHIMPTEQEEDGPLPLLANAKGYALSAVLLLAYIGIGIVFYFSELNCKERPWSFTQSFYFTVVTMSTVGYGDLVPCSPGAKVFTTVYILIGVAVVFTEAGDLYAAITGFFGRRIRDVVQSAYHQCNPAAAAEAIKAAEVPWDVDCDSPWRFYLEHLFSSVFFGIFFNIFISAWIFTYTEPHIT